MKQTAVEWLLYSLARNNIETISVAESIENEHRIIEQAKEMEKEQVIKVFVDITKTTLQNLGIEPTFKDLIDFKKIAEVYYNEEFKNTNL